VTNGTLATKVPQGYSFDTLEKFVGLELGVSDWVTIDQARIDQFADCTGDHQWIHVDRNRASAESPFGGTIAHGFLALSMLATLQMELGVVPPDADTAVNAGVNNVRFKAPVRSGRRIRARVRLLSAEPKGPNRKLLITANTVEIDGENEIALSGELAAMIFKG
jgi:acyl dehydratase